MCPPPSFPCLPPPLALSPDEERCLGLLVARSLAEYCRGLPERDAEGLRHGLRGILEDEADPGEPASERLLARVGCFVTLSSGGELRGCIGNADGRHPIYIAVQRLARAAASRDTRFPPLEPDELPGLRSEITVLGMGVRLPSARVEILAHLEPGLHGVRIRRREKGALLLPKVASRLGWTPLELLEQLCLKAGLDRDGWTDPVSELFAFRARSFEGQVPP